MMNCREVVRQKNRGDKLWEGKHGGDIMKDEYYVSKICYTDPGQGSLSPAVRVVFPFWYKRGQGDIFTERRSLLGG